MQEFSELESDYSLSTQSTTYCWGDNKEG